MEKNKETTEPTVCEMIGLTAIITSLATVPFVLPAISAAKFYDSNPVNRLEIETKNDQPIEYNGKEYKITIDDNNLPKD